MAEYPCTININMGRYYIYQITMMDKMPQPGMRYPVHVGDELLNLSAEEVFELEIDTQLRRCFAIDLQDLTPDEELLFAFSSDDRWQVMKEYRPHKIVH